MKRLLALLIGLVPMAGAFADVMARYDVVPLPKEIFMTPDGTPFRLDEATFITFPAGNDMARSDAEMLASYIAKATGYSLTLREREPADGAINLIPSDNCGNRDEYSIVVTPRRIDIIGGKDGIFYGIQTLRKGIPAMSNGQKVLFPEGSVTDSPRFGYRGAHLDVARHFFTVDEVKSFIDMMALHNLNNFHWHISDDQGWRIEIKRFPRLTSIGSQRAQTVIGHNSGKYDGVPHGGYYTQDEARDIVAYAAARHINVIPEIDMPGHMISALASYPELGCTGGPYKVWEIWGVSDDVLCAGNDKVYDFIDTVLEVITEMFPSQYIHIGGDECPKVRWEKCPKCQAKIRQLGLKTDARSTAEQKLQSHVIRHASDFLARCGRRAIGWEEIMEGGAPKGTVIQSWTGEGAGIEAARQGYDVIMSPTSYMYFDYCQSPDPEKEPVSFGGYVPVERVYSYNPEPEELDGNAPGHIIGPQANLWTEYISTLDHIQYMELPRMAALAEVQWSSAPRDYRAFLHRLLPLISHYELEGYNYARHIYNVSGVLNPDTVSHCVSVELSTCDDAPIHYTLDGSEPTAKSPVYAGTLKLGGSAVIKAKALRKQGMSETYVDTVYFSKSTARPVTLLNAPHPRYTARGTMTLSDGKLGANSYRNGDWVGFYEKPLDAIIDLGEQQQISEATLRCLICSGDWITDAASFAVSVSDDGKVWKELARVEYPDLTQHVNEVRTHRLTFPRTATRYVRIAATQQPMLPSWHPGAGHSPFIFIDELTVN